LLSGGKDGKVRLWSPNVEPGATFDLSGVGSLVPIVRSVCWSNDGKRLLVGTKGSEIFEISADDGSNLHPHPLIQGHCEYELRGLSPHPSRPEVCTVGDDRTLRVWDLVTKRQLKMVRFDAMARYVRMSLSIYVCACAKECIVLSSQRSFFVNGIVEFLRFSYFE
jgi:WD40 repeat protein